MRLSYIFAAFVCLLATQLPVMAQDACDEEPYRFRTMTIPDSEYAKNAEPSFSFARGLYTVGPSFQRVYFGTGDGSGAYNSVGMTSRVHYVMSFDGAKNSAVRTGGCVSARWPVGLPMEAAGSGRPDVFASLEAGLEFGGDRFRIAPLLDMGYALTVYKNVLFVGAAVEAGWDFGKVRVFVMPKVYFTGGKLMGYEMQFAPCVEAGISVPFGKIGA